jgi:hypothetical protein
MGKVKWTSLLLLLSLQYIVPFTMKTSQRSPKVQVPLFAAMIMAGFLTVAIPNLIGHLFDVQSGQPAPQTVTKVAK